MSIKLRIKRVWLLVHVQRLYSNHYKMKLIQFLFVLKTTALEWQMTILNPRIQRTEQKCNICLSRMPVINVKAIAFVLRI